MTRACARPALAPSGCSPSPYPTKESATNLETTMPRRLKAQRPSPSTYYPSQQNSAPSAFGDDRGRIGFPRTAR